MVFVLGTWGEVENSLWKLVKGGNSLGTLWETAEGGEGGGDMHGSCQCSVEQRKKKEDGLAE